MCNAPKRNINSKKYYLSSVKLMVYDNVVQYGFKINFKLKWNHSDCISNAFLRIFQSISNLGYLFIHTDGCRHTLWFCSISFLFTKWSIVTCHQLFTSISNGMWCKGRESVSYFSLLKFTTLPLGKMQTQKYVIFLRISRGESHLEHLSPDT